MLQVLLIAALIYLALSYLGCKIQLLAVSLFFVEHGAREPDDAELEEYRLRVCQNIAKDILHKW